MQIDGARDEAGAGHWSKNVPVGQVLGGLERGQWSADDLADPIDTLPGSNGSSATDGWKKYPSSSSSPSILARPNRNPENEGIRVTRPWGSASECRE